jgi:pectate lyase
VKKRSISVILLAVIMVVNLGSTQVLAIPAGDKIMVLEDFDRFSTTQEAVTGVFGGNISSHGNVQPLYELSQAHYYNGGKSFGLGGLIIPSSQTGSMISPYVNLASDKRDWRGAAYIQFWVKNTSSGRLGIRLELRDASGTSHSLPLSGTFECEMEKRPGEAVFLTTKNNTNRRVYVSPGYEGMMRVPLSLYTTVTDWSGIASIYLGMNVNVDGLGSDLLYYDYFHVVTADFVNIPTRVYPPELAESFVRTNEETMQVCYNGFMDSTNESDIFYLEAIDESGKSLGKKYFKAQGKAHIKAYYQLPFDTPPGKYTLKIKVNGNTDFEDKYIFPVYGREPAAYHDIWDTKCESAVALLDSMGIIYGYGDGSYKPDQTITYGELVDFLTSFSKLSRVMVISYSGMNLNLNENAQYDIAVMMIVKILGRSAASTSGYLTAAKNIGVTRNITEQTATRGNIAVMLKNSLTIELLENDVPLKINIMNKNFEAVMDEVRFGAAKTYGDNILKVNRDVYGTKASPMLIDGINIYTKQPAIYMYGGVQSIISNFTSQQNVLRTLVSLSNLTGDPKYANRAEEVTEYALNNIIDKNGALYVGGHAWWDSFHETTANSKTRSIELKNFFPFYDYWYDTDEGAASKSVGAMWDAKMTNWPMLTFSRHGSYDKTATAIWDNSFSDPEPFYKAGSELPFTNSGVELFISALTEYKETGNEKAKLWARRLISMYKKAGSTETGLMSGVYVLSGGSSISDRGLDQFDMDYPQAKEGWIMGTSQRFVPALPDLIRLYDEGVLDQDIFNWFVDDALGYITYQYDPSNHTNKYILADGTDLTGYQIKRDGYYGSTGSVLKSSAVSREYVYPFVMLYLRTNKMEFWNFARDIANYYGLGDIGAKPGEGVMVNLATKSVQMSSIFAMCELYEQTGCADYLKLARAISNNSMIMYERGYFMTLSESAYINNTALSKKYCNFNDKDAWAMLRIQAAIQGDSSVIPVYSNSYGDVLDDYDGIAKSTVGGLSAIYSGQYNTDSIVDTVLSGNTLPELKIAQPNISIHTDGETESKVINCDLYFDNTVPSINYRPILAVYDAGDSLIKASTLTVTPASSELDYFSMNLSLSKEEAVLSEYAKCFLWSTADYEPVTGVTDITLK